MNPEHRLGWHGADDIKRHPWFASIDWHMLEAHRIGAPMIPKAAEPPRPVQLCQLRRGNDTTAAKHAQRQKSLADVGVGGHKRHAHP